MQPSQCSWPIVAACCPQSGTCPVWSFGAHVWYHCRISPPRFLAECRKRRRNQGSLVFLYFNLSALFDLYLVFACLFSCTALFVTISQLIGCEDSLRNDLYCVRWGVKLCSTNQSGTLTFQFFYAAGWLTGRSSSLWQFCHNISQKFSFGERPNLE